MTDFINQVLAANPKVAGDLDREARLSQWDLTLKGFLDYAVAATTAGTIKWTRMAPNVIKIASDDVKHILAHFPTGKILYTMTDRAETQFLRPRWLEPDHPAYEQAKALIANA